LESGRSGTLASAPLSRVARPPPRGPGRVDGAATCGDSRRAAASRGPAPRLRPDLQGELESSYIVTCWDPVGLSCDTRGGFPRTDHCCLDDLPRGRPSPFPVPGRRIGSPCRCSRCRGQRCHPVPPGWPGRRSGRGRWRCGPGTSSAAGVTMRRSPRRTLRQPLSVGDAGRAREVARLTFVVVAWLVGPVVRRQSGP
jgi:hypothetical protein